MDDEQYLGARPTMLPSKKRSAAPLGIPQDSWDAGELRNLITLLQKHANPAVAQDRGGDLVQQLQQKIAPQPGALEAFNHLQNLREQEAEMLEARSNQQPFRGVSGVLDPVSYEAIRQRLKRK